MRDQRVDSGINTTLYDRGTEMDYLSIHVEPLGSIFEEQVKKASVRNDLAEADLDLCF